MARIQDLHTHPPKVKYSEQIVLSGYWFSLTHTLSHSCYCGLLSLLVYSGLSGPAHPPKVKYSLKQFIVCIKNVYLSVEKPEGRKRRERETEEVENIKRLRTTPVPSTSSRKESGVSL